MAFSASQDEFVCIDLIPPTQGQEAVQSALSENPANGVGNFGPYIPPTEDGTGKDSDLPDALVLNVSKHWAPGRTLRVKFLSGEKALRERVKKFAEQWLLYANIKFNWVADDEPRSHIRVDFAKGKGHNSYVGTDNLHIAQNQRTLNLDITMATPDDQVRRVAIHEFGHAIGCEHEHQSPKATFQWNKEYVYAALAKPPNRWDKAKVDHNVLNRLKPEDVTATEFDPTSIMCYAFPKEWFVSGTGVPTNSNTQLSKRDKEFIATVYPHKPSDIGLFSTMQVRPWDAPFKGRDDSNVAFVPAYSEPPRLAMGLTWFDLSVDRDVSVFAQAEDVARDNFTVSVSAKASNAWISSAAASWLEVAATESEIVVGSVDFTAPGTKSINFESRFNSNDPPTVVAWLQGFEFAKADGPWKLKTYATDATPFKFKLSLETGSGGAEFRSAKVTYIAFPRGKENVAAGTFSTDDVPGLENTGSVVFDQGAAAFATPPQLLTCVSGVDFGAGHGIRLRLSRSVVSTTGFGWTFDSWADSVFNSATATYVAILPEKTDAPEEM